MMPSFSLLAIYCTCLFSFSSYGQVKESTLQSIFLCSSIKYLEWPSSTRSDFVIKVLGNDDVFDELTKTSKSRKLNNKTIIVERITGLASTGDCDVIFLAEVSSNQLEKVVSKTPNEPILIISAKDGFLEKGSDMNLVEKDGKLAFEINKGSIERKGIKISGTLISMALKAI